MAGYFTKQAFNKLKETIFYLEKNQRKEVQEKLKKAISFGDLSENAAYTSAREEQELLEKQIDELKRDLKNAIISESTDKKFVHLDSVVYLEKINKNKSSNKEKIKITLCSPNETNSIKNKISTNSPLGKILFKKKQGDVFSIKIENKTIEYKILKIE